MVAKDYVNETMIKPGDETSQSEYKSFQFVFSDDKGLQEFTENKDKYFQIASSDFRFYVNQALDQYYFIHKQLSSDKTTGITDSAKTIQTLIASVMVLTPDLSKDQVKALQDVLQQIQNSSKTIADMKNVTISSIRKAYEPLSDAFITYVNTFNDAPDGHTAIEYHCGMALGGNGASWLQANDGLLNPYFGSAMLACGSKKKNYTPDCPVMKKTGKKETIVTASQAIYKGRSIRFCCDKCIDTFIGDPGSFVNLP